MSMSTFDSSNADMNSKHLTEETDNHKSTTNATNNVGEQAYLAFLRDIINHGHFRATRNANTYSVFSRQLSFDLSEGFPLLTTKRMFWRGIFEELKFFMLGQTDTKVLEHKGISIWKGNTTRSFLDSVGLLSYPEGDIGPLYGFQWRHFGAPYSGSNSDYTGQGVDQLDRVLHLLATDPFSRRLYLTSFHSDQYTQSPLPPCHGMSIQFGVEPDSKSSDQFRLSCHMYQRSCDTFLGCPFNIASYALLVHLVCAMANHRRKVRGIDRDQNDNDALLGAKLVPGRLTMSFGDCHVYESHKSAVIEQCSRSTHPFPTLSITPTDLDLDNLHNLELSDLVLTDYLCHPAIKVNLEA